MRLSLFALALALLLSSCDPMSSSGGRGGAGPETPAQVTWSNHRGSDRYGPFADLSIGTVTVRLRYIPSGSFTMGSPDGDSTWRGDDEVQHPTIEHGFWLAETEVTQALWDAVMSHDPSQFRDPNRPVDSVSFEEAQRFINTLRARVNGFDVRLPSEAEWEYACRAGTTTAFALDDKAKPAQVAADLGWYVNNADAQTHVVKSKQPNAWGLYDMHGNVAEWCQDIYTHYAAHGSATPVKGVGDQVSRGGSWRRGDWCARSAARRGVPAERGDNDQGLRLAVTAPAPPAEH